MKEMISGEVTTIWEGRGDVDMNEGKGGTRLVGWYLTEAEAKEAVKQEGCWGSPGFVRGYQVLKQKLSNNEVQYWKIERLEVQAHFDYTNQVRKSALAKLTDEEKRVLGVK
jgi:hypothetical protein